MPHRIPQSVALRVPLKAYLSSDHVSDATSKTLAVTISKNGAAFGNPSAGATNTTEIANGWYYVDLSTTDTGTQGPLVIRATVANVDNVEIVYQVVDATNLGASNLDAAVSTRSTFSGGAVASVTAPVTAGTVSDKTGYSLSVTPPTAVQVRQEMDSNSTKLANLDASVSSRSTYSGGAVASVTAPVTVGTNNDKTGYALASDPPTASDIATAVWASGTRTLTSFGSLVADAATAVWGAASRTLSAFGFSVSTDVSATVTTNLDAQVSSVPTAAQNADALLGRTLSGGANGGRTVRDALRVSRNKVVISGNTVTVYAEDDTTVAWTATLTTDAAAIPITGVDPA